MVPARSELLSRCGWHRCRLPQRMDGETPIPEGIQVPDAHSLVLGSRRAGARLLPDLHVRTQAEPGPQLRGGDLHERRARR